MADRETIKGWLDGYLRAWNSSDREDIGNLFAADGLYYTGPFDDPWRGREGIVEEWLKREDEPGSWEFEYEILAVEKETGVVQGRTHYKEPPRTYSNIWLIRLNEQDECTEFVEWWMKKK